MKENGGKTKRQDKESNKNGIRNNSLHRDDRISMVEMVWARCKNGGERYPKIPCQARTQGKDIQRKTWTDQGKMDTKDFEEELNGRKSYTLRP